MRKIQPEPGKVPRGTLRRIWRHRFEVGELAAIIAGAKTQFRVPVSSATTDLPPDEFRQINWARVEPEPGARGWSCGLRRLEIKRGEARLIAPMVKVGDVLFAGGRGVALHEPTDSMQITGVRAESLRNITQADAEREGVLFAARAAAPFPLGRDAAPSELYHALTVGRLGEHQRRQWLASDEHSRARLTGKFDRAAFAVDWIRKSRSGSIGWRASPLVWVFSFSWYPLRPCDLIARLDAGTLERKSA